MEIKGLDLSPTVSMLDGIQESLQANQNAMIASIDRKSTRLNSSHSSQSRMPSSA